MLTADTVTDEQLHREFDRLIHLPWLNRSNQEIHDTKLLANALGHGGLVEGVDCRMPLGFEAEYARRGRARCAEILNARAWDAGHDAAVKASGHVRCCDCETCCAVRVEAVRAEAKS